MMKSFLLIFTIVFSFLPATLWAGNPNVVAGRYHVDGICEQCQKRIEDAAYVKGVKYAGWEVATHMLTVKYDSTKTSPGVFLKTIAAAGHDNELYKASEAEYDQLPACCRYRSKKT